MLSLEVVTLGVTDLERALAFYVEKVGFSLDVDYQPTAQFRVVQVTPPGSACSIHLVRSSEAKPLRDFYLVTDDLAITRDKLIARGVAVGDIRHKHPWETWSGEFAPGLDPQRRSYSSFADFSDPDGNTWTLQERGFSAS